MKLHEYQAKKILFRYKLPIPFGYICSNLNELEKSSLKINSDRWVLKCQVHAGGRGKSGGIKIVYNKKDIKTFANKWFGNMIKTNQTDNNGKIVEKILIEEAKTNILHELYLGILIDTISNNVIAVASKEGGISVEKTAKKNLKSIHKVILDPCCKAQLYQGRFLAYKLNLKNEQVKNFTNIFMKLSKMFFDLDLSLLEINPLIIDDLNNLICLDSKITVDKNAKFRQKEIFNIYDVNQDNPNEVYAEKHGLNYVALSGNIGCLVNGAGLAMATMDIIKLYGGKPANFLDIGGGIKQENITKALDIILSDKKIRAILINIFGGIVRCDFIADGIINFIKSKKINIPIVVRLEGNNSDIGFKKLLTSKINIIPSHDLENAVKTVVEVSKR